MVHNGIFEKGQCVQNLPIITAVGSHTAIKIGINVKYTEVDGNKKVDSSDHQIVSVQFDLEYLNDLKRMLEEMIHFMILILKLFF